MVRIAMIADVHAANHKRWGGPVVGGVNERGWEVVHSLERASEIARTNNCDSLYVLGDLFDNTRPTPPLVAAVARALVRSGVHVHVVVGNHDRQSMHDLDQACAPLSLHESITVHTEPRLVRYGVSLEVVAIPYSAGEAKDWLPAGLAAIAQQFTTGRRVVLTHLGIFDEDTPAYLKASHDAVGVGHVRWLCEQHRIDLFAAGNWHECRRWKPRAGTHDPEVLIPGTFCPHNFSDPEDHGRVWVYDSAHGEHGVFTSVTVPTPLFLQGVASQLDGVALRVARHYTSAGSARAYVRLKGARSQLQEVLAARDALLLAQPRSVVDVVIEDSADEEVRAAAKAAVAAGESHATLLDYAGLADVADPGTKDGVLRRLAEYRKEAG